MSYIDYSYNDNNFRNFRNDAYKAQLVLDSYYKPDENGLKAYTKHLQNCRKNPTIGMLITNEIINDSGINFPRTYSRNKHLLLKNPEIKKLINEIDNTIEKIYFPRTLKAREFLIKTRRVVLDNVMPVKHNLRRELFRTYNAIYQNFKRLK